MTTAGWLPAGTRLLMTFGTLSGDLFESSSNRSPERAVLFYAAGFEPVKVGGIEESTRLDVGGDLHDLVVSLADARSLIG